jgi:hypothetical protein
MDLMKGELGSCSEPCAVSPRGGNEFTFVNVECITDITEEEGQDPMKIPVIKTEPKVSCMSVVSVTHISYRLYPELPATIYVCFCNKILTLREWILSSFFF